MRTTHINYQIEDVRDQLTPELKEEIVQLWLSEKALPENIARERVSNTYQTIRNADNQKLLGIVSGHLIYIDAMRMHFHHCTGFVAEAYRSQGLFIKTFRDTYYLLNKAYVSGENTKASGVYISVENALLKSHNSAIWWGGDKGEVPYVFMGYSARGSHIRIAYFEGVTV